MKVLTINPDLLKKNYVEDGMSMAQIAEVYGKSLSAIHYNLIRNNIPRRKISDILTGRKLSKEAVEKMRVTAKRLWQTGIRKPGWKLTEETKRKMTGRIPWNKGKGVLKERFPKPKLSTIEALERKRRLDRIYAKTVRKQKRKERRNLDAKYRLDCNISSVVSSSLREAKNYRKWQNLVGYSINDLMAHLEKQFDEKMSWSNYGSYWWIDHIKPRSVFNYIVPEDTEFKECWGLVNLQPLEKIANMRKGNRYFKVETN